MDWTIPLFILFLLLVVLALFGNLLVCAAILWDRSLRRQPENLFLVSLAVSDLLVSVLVMVFAAGNDLLGYWPFGQFYCQFWVAFDITCCTASILNLCAISLDRYWHISRPMVYVRYCNRRRIYYAIVVVWLLSAAIGAAPLGFGFGSKVFPDNDTGLPVCEMRLPLWYAICSSMGSFFVPAAVMVLLYTKLYLYARRHVRSIKTQLQQATSFLIMQLASEKIREVTATTLNLKGESLLPQSSNRNATRSARRQRRDPTSRKTPKQTRVVSNGISIGDEEDDNEDRKFIRSSIWAKLTQCVGCKRKESIDIEDQGPVHHQSNNRNNVSDQKARLTLGVIMGTFLVCWLPFFVVNIIRAWSPNSLNHIFVVAVTWLGYANSAANPLIYSIFNRDFRRAFKKILSNLFHCWEHPDLNKSISSRMVVPEVDRRKSCSKSISASENNNDQTGTQMNLLNNNESIAEEA